MRSGSPFAAVRRSLTLVEVLAALAILGGTATALMSVQARSLETLRHAQRDVIAQRLAGELIRNWRLQAADLSAAEAGAFDGSSGWTWSRRAEPVALSPQQAGLRVRLSVRFADEAGRAVYERVFEWITRHDKTS